MSTTMSSSDASEKMSATAKNGLSFTRSLCSPSLGAFSPRVGKVVLRREIPVGSESQSTSIELDTPAAITWTSRGIVPHLTRDHVAQSDAAGWVHVPFESFLERSPPVPTLQHQQNPADAKPLHSFLGFPPDRHILSMSLRDPNNVRELPPNGDKSISAWCVRGVRKVPPSTFLEHTFACVPDILVAPADTPYTAPPFSQRRIHKNVERSAAWLAEILKSTSNPQLPSRQIPILLPLAGLTVPLARSAFSALIQEKLSGREAVELSPLGLRCLDDGVWGYFLELGPLRPSYSPLPIVTPSFPLAESENSTSSPVSEGEVVSNTIALLRTSLKTLPVSKARVAISTESPQEVLRLINEVGVDLIDVSSWSSECARRGIGFDFTFPVSDNITTRTSDSIRPSTRSDGKLDIGHNLFATAYAHDFSRIADNFLDGELGATGRNGEVCPCIACSPRSNPTDHASYDPPHTRAYIHHLLHTHEMSAYALLEAHNTAVVDSFFSGVRKTLSSTLNGESSAGDDSVNDIFSKEVSKFIAYYALPPSLLEEATRDWEAIEKSRGKGSLKRARDAEASTEGKDREEIQASIALGGTQSLGELVDRVKLDAPAVLMLDPAPNVDVDTDVI